MVLLECGNDEQVLVYQYDNGYGGAHDNAELRNYGNNDGNDKSNDKDDNNDQ